MNSDSNAGRKSMELRAFGLLTAFLAPILAILIVGGLGFTIWIFQLFSGPPGPPV